MFHRSIADAANARFSDYRLDHPPTVNYSSVNTSAMPSAPMMQLSPPDVPWQDSGVLTGCDWLYSAIVPPPSAATISEERKT